MRPVRCSIVLAVVAAVLAAFAAVAAPNDEAFSFRADFAPNESSPGDALARTASLIDRRLRARHLQGSARPADDDGIVVRLPADKRGELARLTAPGRLFFFDWEANVLGADGRPHPGDQTVTGGSSAGYSAGLRYYDAVLRAARRPAGAGGGSSSTGDEYYVVSDGERTVRRGPVRSPSEIHPSRGERIVKVSAGTLVVRGEADPSTHKRATRYYVLNEAPAVAGTELRNVRAGDAAPSVSFDLTPAGLTAYNDLMRAVADRGRARRAAQHFAAVIDGELLTVPMVDNHQRPMTITKGVEIEGGFTRRSARDLALLLRLGPLPVVRLRRSP